MLSYTEAQDIVKSFAISFGTEAIGLEQADNRILAEDVYADRDYPPFNRSTMDGYAVNSTGFNQDLKSFKIQQVIFAGETGNDSLQAGYCFKIMTGAPVPLSADAVIRREDAIQIDNEVRFQIGVLKPFQNIARQGEDVANKSLILTKQTLCTPSVISLLATLGKSVILVEKLPRVALFTTGNEVVGVDEPIIAHQIRNSNRYMLLSLLNKWLIKPVVCDHIADDKESLHKAINNALQNDIIITCGGVSAGDADYLPEVFAELGISKLFHKLAIKPGKPVWCGKLPAGGLVFALPGNPFSSMVTFKLLIDHYLSACFGLTPIKLLHLPFNGTRKKSSSFYEFFPCTISGTPSALTPVNINTSGDIRLGLSAQVLAFHPANVETLNIGDLIDCLLL